MKRNGGGQKPPRFFYESPFRFLARRKMLCIAQIVKTVFLGMNIIKIFLKFVFT